MYNYIYNKNNNNSYYFTDLLHQTVTVLTFLLVLAIINYSR